MEKGALWGSFFLSNACIYEKKAVPLRRKGVGL